MEWHIGWGITQRCNLKCKHCYNSSGAPAKNELSLEEAKGYVNKLVKGGILSINYGTGESNLLPYFWDLVAYVHSKGIMQGLTTNGSSINYKTIIQAKQYLNDVDVSLDYVSPEKHNAFRGKKDAWDWAINALDLLKKHQVSFSIVTCLHSENSTKETIDQFIELCREYNCEWRINWYKPTGRGKDNDLLKLDPRVVYEIFAYIIGKTDLVALPDPLFAALLHVNEREGCPCGKTSFRITPSGKIVPCVYLTKEKKIDSLKDVHFENILSSPLFYQINNREIEECKDCDFFKTCRGGCATRAYLEHGTMNAPDAFCFKKIGLKESPLEGIEYNFVSAQTKVHEEYLCTMIVKPKK